MLRPSRVRWLARSVAVAAALVAGTVLLGWITGRTELTTLGARLSMKANTAACFLLLAGALWRRASASPPARDGVVAALSGTAALVGGLTLLEHLVGVDLGIDRLLSDEPPGAPGTMSPGRMGPPASTSFLLLGTALACLHLRARAARVAVHVMAVGTAFVALLPIVGYAYGADALYGVARYTGIALPTAMLLEVVALTALTLVPDSELISALRGSGTSGHLARRTLLYSTALPLVAGAAIARGLDAGLYDGVFAVSFLALSLILLMALLTSRDAVHIARIGAQLDESTARARARAAELETVLDSVPSAVFITHDPDSRRMEANRFAREMLGTAPQANVSLSASGAELPTTYRVRRRGEEVPAEDLPVQVAAARGAEVRDEQLEIVLADGRVRHVVGNASPLRDADGRPYGAVGAFVDITRRVEAEEALREADRRKDEFLAVLSHELRNPLAPIRNALFLLAREPLEEERARAKLAVVERQVSHLTRLIDDLLDVSRISRGKVRVERTALDLAELVRRAAEDHRDAAVAAGLRLAVDVPDGRIWVRGDATRLAQVVGNLVGNAVKFTPRGGEITVALRREGEAAVLRVRDTGVGIDEAMRPRLFQPFAQADQPLDRSRGGLGLGLTLVRGFVAVHGGTVEARSEGTGRGAEFVVRLPVDAAPPRSTASSDAPAIPPVPLRVLVVEDNEDAAETLRDVLALAGHEVAVAWSGADGVEQARRWRPDVVFCDIGLPGLDGYAVARAIREETGARPVLVALTGYASPEDRRRASEAGFDHHVAKPPDPAAVLALLAAASRGRQPAPAAASPA